MPFVLTMPIKIGLDPRKGWAKLTRPIRKFPNRNIERAEYICWIFSLLSYFTCFSLYKHYCPAKTIIETRL